MDSQTAHFDGISARIVFDTGRKCSLASESSELTNAARLWRVVAFIQRDY